MKRIASDCEDFYEVPNKRPTLTLRPSQVPSYLQTSAFFQNLNIVEDDSFVLSKIYFKMDQHIVCYQDLEVMLETIRFWGLDHIPTELIDFAITHDLHEHQATLKNYEYELPYLKDLARISSVRHSADLMMLHAMRSGCIELVAAIHPHLLNWSQKHLEIAIHHGQLHVLQYALNYGAKECVQMDLLYWRAVQSGRVECVKFLVQAGYPVPVRIAEKAVRKSQIEILRYLIGLGCSLHGAVHTALEQGNVECLRILVEEGHFNIHQEGTYAAVLAAKANSVSCLQYLHSIQHSSVMCPEVSYQAARRGYLDCLQYAHSIGSPFVPQDCIFAAVHNNHIHILEYLLQQGCVLEPKDHHGQVALRQRNFTMLRFLICRGCNIPECIRTQLIELSEYELVQLLV